jgi:hypothetical protein
MIYIIKVFQIFHILFQFYKTHLYIYMEINIINTVVIQILLMDIILMSLLVQNKLPHFYIINHIS